MTEYSTDSAATPIIDDAYDAYWHSKSLSILWMMYLLKNMFWNLGMSRDNLTGSYALLLRLGECYWYVPAMINAWSSPGILLSEAELRISKNQNSAIP